MVKLVREEDRKKGVDDRESESTGCWSEMEDRQDLDETDEIELEVGVGVGPRNFLMKKLVVDQFVK